MTKKRHKITFWTGQCGFFTDTRQLVHTGIGGVADSGPKDAEEPDNEADDARGSDGFGAALIRPRGITGLIVICFFERKKKKRKNIQVKSKSIPSLLKSDISDQCARGVENDHTGLVAQSGPSQVDDVERDD